MKDYIKKLSPKEQKQLEKDIWAMRDKGRGKSRAYNNALVEVIDMLLEDEDNQLN